MRAPRILLYDIDGTLVLTGGAGRRAMRHAFGAVTGNANALVDISLGGMTDRLILRAGFEAIGHAFEEKAVEELLALYVEKLREEVPRSEGYEIMPAAVETVEHTLGLEGVAVGLGTGNVREGAHIKLERAGLASSFAFGGYGSDAEDRGEVLRIGAERGAASLGVPLVDCRVLVIGDTPRDVSAAHEIGAACVAVGTGSHTTDSLRAAGADFVYDDLTHPDLPALLLEA